MQQNRGSIVINEPQDCLFRINYYINSKGTGTVSSVPFAAAQRSIMIIMTFNMYSIGQRINAASQPIIGIAQNNEIINNISSKFKNAFEMLGYERYSTPISWNEDYTQVFSIYNLASSGVSPFITNEKGKHIVIFLRSYPFGDLLAIIFKCPSFIFPKILLISLKKS